MALRVAVIGAGIVGSSCAYHLARRGVEVTVFEREDGVAMGSTGRSAAGFRTQFSTRHNVELSLLSLRWYKNHDSGYRPIGYLFLIPETLWEDQMQRVELQRAAGALTEVLTVAQAQEILEFNPEGVVGATFGPRDGFVDPDRSAQLLMSSARQEGTVLRRLEPVVGLTEVGQGWTIHTPRGQYHSDVVVNATGAWAGELAAMIDLEVPITPLRNEVFVTAPRPRPRPAPLTIDMASGVYLRSEGDRLLLGHHDEAGKPGFIEGIEWSHLDHIAESLAHRYPWFEHESLDRRACWWGYYEMTPDRSPILGRATSHPNFVNAAGFSGHGVMHAPATGLLISEEILDDGAHSVDITPFRLERFNGGEVITERAVI